MAANNRDADGLGSVRTRELMHAGRLMGIEGSRIRVVDDPALPDGLHSPWPPDAVAGHVAAALTAYEPATVVTFDGYGVSGHPNHQAPERAVVEADWAGRGFRLEELREGFGGELRSMGQSKDELLVVAEGEVECEVGGAPRCRLAPGDEVFVPESTPYSVRNVGEKYARLFIGYA